MQQYHIVSGFILGPLFFVLGLVLVLNAEKFGSNVLLSQMGGVFSMIYALIRLGRSWLLYQKRKKQQNSNYQE
ncbi:MAG: hypothetical protein RML72_10240 [Bacteroidia bacterium]|nr:hypothetical protein [Bacteroidia bacterium]MDW8159237.1 hypothetical protein [Bacteroidia bacterium]